MTKSSRFPVSSPVFPYIDSMASSLERVAPEKAAELHRYLTDRRVRLVLDQNTKSWFRARRGGHGYDILCSIYGAEVLWASALAYVSVHRHLKELGGRSLVFSDHDDLAHLQGLLEFAFDDRVTRDDEGEWPSDLPRPRFTTVPEDVDTVVLASELWLCALAWILHHELTHIRNGHLEKLPDVGDEIEADAGATDWLIRGVTDMRVMTKRGLGIAIAVVALSGFVLHHGRQRGPRRYPPAGERIMTALERLPQETCAHELACVGVKIHLDRWNINCPSTTFDNGADCLAAFCTVLSRWEMNRV
jgi:hypothetical protein